MTMRERRRLVETTVRLEEATLDAVLDMAPSDWLGVALELGMERRLRQLAETEFVPLLNACKEVFAEMRAHAGEEEEDADSVNGHMIRTLRDAVAKAQATATAGEP